MGLLNTETINETDFITEATRNATPANDANRVVKNEADGRPDSFFLRTGLKMTYGETINGATLPVPIYIDSATGKVMACDANVTSKLAFRGFAIQNGVLNDVKKVRFSGIVGGFTGLTVGAKYYLNDAVGTISTTIGTYEVLVGVAVSATEIMTEVGGRCAAGAGSALGVASGSQAIVCGFRPTKIKLTARLVDRSGSTPNVIALMDAVYVNGAMTAVSALYGTGANIAVTDNNARLYGVAAADYMTFTITSITETGFTVTWTETGAFALNALTPVWMWEADGEL